MKTEQIHAEVRTELFRRALKGCGKFTALFINAGERSLSKNENELETCSAVYSLFTIDHFLYYVFFILSQEKKPPYSASMTNCTT